MNPIDYLYSLELHGIKLGLENIAHLLERAGDPHRSYPVLHVAGSNGKGSVVAILDAIFRAAGYRIGRFTSPHLFSVRERFVINGRMMSDEALDEQIEFFRNAAKMDHDPTFFELNTAIAFRHFAVQSVDLALIEVGLGGRFDSTNVVTPVVSGITTIALEHTQYLGDTLESIAFEKAGIIKPGIPVVLGEIHEKPRGVIEKRAADDQSPLVALGRDFCFTLTEEDSRPMFGYAGSRYSFDPVPFSLPGTYQGANAAVAVAMAEQGGKRFPKLNVDSVKEGLSKARWPCRLERVLEKPTVLIDVAHNAAGARELAKSVGAPCTLVLAVASDKNANEMLKALAPIMDRLILTEFSDRRAMAVERLSEMASGRPHECAPDVSSALKLAFKSTPSDGMIVVAGSLFTAGEARRILVDDYGAAALQF